MAPKVKRCQYCRDVALILQNGWRLRNSSSYAKLCVPCVVAYESGTFCLKHHANEDGWRQCSECEKNFHCECIMSIHLFETNESCGITCKKCIAKKSDAE